MMHALPLLRILPLLALMLCGLPVQAEEGSPWGAAVAVEYPYQPQRVVFDLTTGDAAEVNEVLGRVSELNNLYAADPFAMHIVVLVHGEAIPFFTRARFDVYRTLMTRAQSLTLAGPVEFRLCQLAARVRHEALPVDIHGFVTMVPNGDAELIRLQREEGYAYMR